MNDLDVYNQTELEAYQSMTISEKIKSLECDATGMGWWYSTNKERQISQDQWLTQEALLFYIKHLKMLRKRNTQD